MSEKLRLATFNLENFDDKPGQAPALDERVAVMRPQLVLANADVLCLQEVNSQKTATGTRKLLALQKLIEGTQYAGYKIAHTVTQQKQPYEERNIVVLSRFPFSKGPPCQISHEYVADLQCRKVIAIPSEPKPEKVDWERPILYVKLEVAGRLLHLLVVHLKSKIPTDIEGQKVDDYIWRTAPGWAEGFFLSSMERVGQALETRMLIDTIFDEAAKNKQEPWIAACGDFNSDTDDVPLTAICGPVEETGNPALGTRVMVPCEFSIPESSRFSILYLGKGLMYDHILVSRPLLAYYRGAESQTETLPDGSGAFRTDVKFPEYDHAPVIASFEIL